MRRCLLALAATATTLAVTASSAAAQPGCSVPSQGSWHSCLSAAHRAVIGTNQVRFTRATPVLVVRYSACPEHLIRRKVTIRTGAGARIAAKRVDGRCTNGVARWRTTLHPDLDLRAGTVVRSFWSRLADEDSAPRIKLGNNKQSGS